MLDAYLKARTEMIQLGEAGALKKWTGSETGVYQPHHYGTSSKAACGVERGVQGNIRQEVLWHTLDAAKVDCPECLETMENQ